MLCTEINASSEAARSCEKPERYKIEHPSAFQTGLNLQDPDITLCANRLNVQQFHVLPTQCIYVFCVDLRTNSHYFPIQH